MSAERKLAWTAFSYSGATCLFVLCSAFTMPESTPHATNIWDVFLSGKDLGIFAGIIVAFMVTVWRIIAGESKRRALAAQLQAESLSETRKSMEAMRQSIASLSLSIATGIHNVNEAADRRLNSTLETMRTRPCFMDGPIQKILEAATHGKEPHA